MNKPSYKVNAVQIRSFKLKRTWVRNAVTCRQLERVTIGYGVVHSFLLYEAVGIDLCRAG